MLTTAGIRLVATVRAGVAPRESRGPHELDEDCKVRGAPLSARYEDGNMAVACDEDHLQPVAPLPSNAISGRDLADVVVLVIRTFQRCEFVRRSVCPVCYGTMGIEHVVVEAAPSPSKHVFRGTCGGCGMIYAAPTGTYLVRHPAVVDFCRDHGVQIDDGGYWNIDLPVTGGSVVGRDPLRVAVSETLDDDRLRVVVSSSLDVVESRRETV